VWDVHTPPKKIRDACKAPEIEAAPVAQPTLDAAAE